MLTIYGWWGRDGAGRVNKDPGGISPRDVEPQSVQWTGVYMMSTVYGRNKQRYKFVKKYNSFVRNKQYPLAILTMSAISIKLPIITLQQFPLPFSNLYYPSAISITFQQSLLNYPSAIPTKLPFTNLYYPSEISNNLQFTYLLYLAPVRKLCIDSSGGRRVLHLWTENIYI